MSNDDASGVHFRKDEIEGIVLGEWYQVNTQRDFVISLVRA
jgi:hypothetical protein